MQGGGCYDQGEAACSFKIGQEAVPQPRDLSHVIPNCSRHKGRNKIVLHPPNNTSVVQVNTNNSHCPAQETIIYFGEPSIRHEKTIRKLRPWVEHQLK